MAATIVQTVYDSEKLIEDKVRGLPANQGLNNNAMWIKIDTEIAQSKTDSKFYPATARQDKHGN
jgi:hypothetical protein